MTSGHPPNWYPDPSARHELRYWDGQIWTTHVSTGGRQSVDEGPIQAGPVPVGSHSADRVQRQVQTQAGVVTSATGGGTIFTEPVLVVNQKAKLIEVNNEYAIYDQHGRQLGAVRQVGQSTARKVIRVLTSVDQFLTHRLQIVDVSGHVLLTLTRPAKIVRSRLSISDGDGREIGEVVQENVFGKIHFALVVAGHKVGSINAKNWRAWDFSVEDHLGTEVARITKTWEGLAKTLFTTADNYVLHIHRPLEEPLRSLVVASALCVDTALKQDSRGFG